MSDGENGGGVGEIAVTVQTADAASFLRVPESEGVQHLDLDRATRMD